MASTTHSGVETFGVQFQQVGSVMTMFYDGQTYKQEGNSICVLTRVAFCGPHKIWRKLPPRAKKRELLLKTALKNYLQSIAQTI